MALGDVVVDTNVLVHCSSGDAMYSQASLEFVEHLLACATALVMDEGFHPDESKNRSRIGAEYLNKLPVGSVGRQLLISLAMRSRVRVAAKPTHAVRKAAIQLVRKPRDRTFLVVACMSSDKVLVSHDFEDFQVAKRREIRAMLDVAVLVAQDASPLL